MYEQIDLWNHQKSINSSDDTEPNAQVILSTDGEAIFYRDFFNADESDKLFLELNASTQWQQDTITLYGKRIPLPRLQAWYGDEGKSYTYSGIEQHPKPWTPVLSTIKARIEKAAQVKFNSVLLNLYRHGKDSVAWHSDDESELGQNPIIGSASFGDTRRFSLKHKQFKDRKVEIDLPHGSFLLMRDATQHYWQHQIAKTTKAVRPRINLTFRIVR